MPQDWNESLDTPAAFDAAATFEGGQFSYAKARTLAVNQAALLQDCEIQITGQVSTRFGTAQVGGSVGAGTKIEGIFYYNSIANQYEVALTNGNFYKNVGGVWTLIGAFTMTDTPSICQGVNNLYLCAGADIYSWDGTTLTNLSSDAAATAPRNASILLWHMNRLVAAGGGIKGLSTDPQVPDAIYFSDLLAPPTWGATKAANQIRVGAGDGQANVAVVPWSQFNLAVFKRHSIYVVNADPTLSVSDFPIRLVNNSVGCIARKTAVQAGNDILFLSDDGVRSLGNTVGSDTRQELSIPVSFPVQDYINRINWSAVAVNACAAFWRNLYMISLPLDSSSTNNYVLVYNTITKSWSGVWTGLPINCFSIREVSSVTRLMMGLATTNKVVDYNDYILPANWVNSTFQDYNGAAVQMRVITRSFLFNDPLGIKVAKGGEIEWNNSDGTLKIYPIIDETSLGAVNSNTSINVSSGGFTPPVIPPFLIAPSGLSRARFDLMQYGEFRELQLDIQGLTGGRKEIRQISVAGFVRPTLVGNS